MQQFQGPACVQHLLIEGLVSVGTRRTSGSFSDGWEYHGKVNIAFAGQFACTGSRTGVHGRSDSSHSKVSAVKHGQSRRRLFIFSVRRQKQHSAREFPTPVGLVSFGTRRAALRHRTPAVGALGQQPPGASRPPTAKPPFTAHPTATPNPSLKRTRNGKRRMAFISFWAMRRLPLRAA
jgi:hypothetical protein